MILIVTDKAVYHSNFWNFIACEDNLHA